MRFKTFLFSIIAVALAGNIYAQDKIYKANGDIIDAKIKNVGTKTISYTRFDNQTGPEYTIMKLEVSKIKYENGSEDNFENNFPGMPRPRFRSRTSTSDAPSDTKTKYGPNLLAVAPLQFTDNGLGFSFSYERVLDKGGIIAFYIPVIVTFNLNNGTYYNVSTGTTQNGHQDAMYYAMPGIMLYPTGCYGRVRYGIGPSVVLATGEKSSANYDPYGGTNYQTLTHTMLGMMLNNSLNINPGPHVYIGFEFGLGFTYLNRVDGLNQGTAAIVQGGFKVGYRF